MLKKRSFASFAGAVVLAGCAATPMEDKHAFQPLPVKPPTVVDGITYLDQNWSSDTREWYYNTSQGSQLIPYAWAMALEDEAGKPFMAGVPAAYGYLKGTAGTWNPDLLPVGFVKDAANTKQPWLGLTCAACHTGEITVPSALPGAPPTVMRIDGGQSTGDLYALLAGLDATLKRTLSENGAFTRFANKVLGPNPTPADTLKLYDAVKGFSADYATFVKQSTPSVAWGPMRTDAFNMIFNRVSVIDLGIPANNRDPAAPVSYPHVWDAPMQPVVQWNGVIPNSNELEAVLRNAGEVLGVFGKAEIKKPTLTHYYYDSTVRVKNLVAMERHVRDLRSPSWPTELLGTVDTVKAAKGQALYQESCQSCHAVMPRDRGPVATPIKMTSLFTYVAPQDQAIKAICTDGVDKAVQQNKITPVYDVDSRMAVNAVCRTVLTGPIKGTKMPPLIGHTMEAQDTAVNLLLNAVTGVVLGSALTVDQDVDMALEPSAIPWPAGTTTASASRALAQPKAGDAKSAKGQQLSRDLDNWGERWSTAPEKKSTVTDPLVYKARPLNGIWATAPYMHNGSIPNLYEVLLPAAQRSKSFPVGSRAFDPRKVGVDTTATDSRFILDTGTYGNRNTGHEFTNTLSDEQRWQLIEYIKTL